MNEKQFVDMFMDNICLVDPKVSLEAKGFYYAMLMNMYNKNHSLSELIDSQNYDKDFIYSLIIELVENGYLFLTLKYSKNDSIFVFESNKKN